MADERVRINEDSDTDKDTVVIRNLSKVRRHIHHSVHRSVESYPPQRTPLSRVLYSDSGRLRRGVFSVTCLRQGSCISFMVLLSQVYRGGLTDCCRRLNRAVDSMCLGVRQKECFGLLGVNGEWGWGAV